MTSTIHSMNFSVLLVGSNLVSRVVELAEVTAMENEYFTNKASLLRHTIAPSLKTLKSNPTSSYSTLIGVSLALESNQFGLG